MKHLKRIVTLLWVTVAFLAVSVLIYLGFKGKFPVFFTSWAFIWRARLLAEMAAAGALITLIGCCLDLLRKKGDAYHVFIFKHLLHFWSQFSKLTNRQLAYVQIMTLIFFISSLGILEFSLRQAQVYASRGELGHGGYVSTYDASHERGWLHCSIPKFMHHFVSPEFTWDAATNSQGFFDHEWQIPKKKSVRIACIGDSFTQGVGAVVADSSYPALLGALLSDKAEVMNLGVSGSDPIFGAMVLKQVVLPYHPDIVTLTVNGTDINDVVVRGGMERFGADGKTHFRQAPWWEGLYAHCYLFRLIMFEIGGIDGNTHLTQQALQEEQFKSLTVLESALDQIHGLCADQHIRLIIVFHPDESEVKENRMRCEPIMRYCQGKGYEVLDGLAAFKKLGMNPRNAHQYFWMQDAHNNRFGYEFLAKALKQEIETPDQTKTGHSLLTTSHSSL